MKVLRYAALGDSFSAGADPPDAVRPWPAEVARRLALAHPDLRYYNLGSAGATSGEVVQAQLGPAIELGPDVVSVVCGANDVLLSFSPDIDAYAVNLALVLSRLAAELPGSAVLTATTPNFGEFLPLHPRSRHRVRAGMEALNAATREVASKHGVVCIPVAEHPRARVREHFGPDAIHPSRRGRDLVAEVVVETLEQALGVRAGPPPAAISPRRC